jgi:hypothetical protein
MELAYEKLMAEHGLTLAELPTDAKTGIKSVKQIAHAMHMTEQRGHTVKQATIDKLKANDKWTVREILDYVENKDTNSEELPNDTEEVIEEIQEDEEANSMSPEDQAKFDQGVAIETELENLSGSGKLSYTTEELKSSAPKTYKVIFDTYTQGEQNGVKTTRFSLIESPDQEQTFNLTQN